MNEVPPNGSVDQTELPSKSPTHQGTSIRTEAWRGAKFGAKWAAVILGTVVVIAWMFLAGLMVYRWASTGHMPVEFSNARFWRELPRALAGLVGGILICSAYGAAAGAILMSLAAVMRRQRISTD